MHQKASQSIFNFGVKRYVGSKYGQFENVMEISTFCCIDFFFFFCARVHDLLGNDWLQSMSLSL